MAYIDKRTCNIKHVAECFNRTITSRIKARFDAEPDVPGHWLYTDYLDKYRDEAARVSVVSFDLNTIRPLSQDDRRA